jgi:hypothetical protein
MTSSCVQILRKYRRRLKRGRNRMGFFSLPRELRDMIYERILLSESPPQTYAEVFDKSSYKRIPVLNSDLSIPRAPPPSPLSISLINRQIAAEAGELYQKLLHGHRLISRLDCAITGASRFKLKWLSFPVKPSHLETLFLNIHFVTPPSYPELHDSRRDWRLLGPPLGTILKKLVTFGPRFEGSAFQDRSITIGRLLVHIKSFRPYEDCLDEDAITRWNSRSYKGLNPHQLVEGLIHSWSQAITTNPTCVLRDKIDYIKIFVDEQMVWEFDSISCESKHYALESQWQ